MQRTPRLALTLVLAGVASACSIGPSSRESAPLAAQCWGDEAAVDDETCVPLWTDSLRSTIEAHRSRARDALRVLGGRRAVDALRADFERAPNPQSRLAVIMAMGTTGSPGDVAFLVTQLQGPFTGDADVWYPITAAATTLGLLRATAARDSLRAVLVRNNEPNTFAGSAIATALASLDRPPCADSVTGDLERELIRIVMQCGPTSMSPRRRYNDSTAGGVWSFEGDSWRFSAGTLVDSVRAPRVRAEATIDPGATRAKVTVSTWCGPLCGEGRSYRLMRTGKQWRVVSAVMEWVS